MSYQEKVTIVLILFFIAVAVIASLNDVHAAGDRYTTTTTTNNYITETQQTRNVINKEANDAIAIAIAAGQHNLSYDYGVTSLSVALGGFKESTAVSVAAARRPCKSCPLFSGQLSTDGEDHAYGVAAGYRF